jgi:hypothetical protein
MSRNFDMSEMIMGVEWSVTNLVIQALAGVAGAHAAASVAHEHKFGFSGHSLVGLIAGALSDYFLQVVAVTTVNRSGQEMPVGKVEIIVIQVLSDRWRNCNACDRPCSP